MNYNNISASEVTTIWRYTNVYIIIIIIITARIMQIMMFLWPPSLFCLVPAMGISQHDSGELFLYSW